MLDCAVLSGWLSREIRKAKTAAKAKLTKIIICTNGECSADPEFRRLLSTIYMFILSYYSIANLIKQR
ncbi:TPA: hypothetical protein DCZ32_04415 [Candidatus Uhrbacteria bacterium]|nr:hypothetical protein [Candidatus Uhrbacteria bacterium]